MNIYSFQLIGLTLVTLCSFHLEAIVLMDIFCIIYSTTQSFHCLLVKLTIPNYCSKSSKAHSQVKTELTCLM